MSIFGPDGRVDIAVDTLGFLANTLRGYEATSILREQLQNADDACHKQGRAGELVLEFRDDRLVVSNSSVFDDEDWRRISRPSSRGKFTDAEQTGEFGIGFWGSLHLTDRPLITSGSYQVTLDPVEGATKRDVPPIEGTRFEFPYRRIRTDVGDQLDVGIIDEQVEAQMVDVFVDQMAELLLFTRSIRAITLIPPDGLRRRAERSVRTIRPGVDVLTVQVEGAPQQNCQFLLVRTQIADPPPNRHGNVSIALPISRDRQGEGTVFVTFPTDTSTGLAVSIEAHFRATDDRRSIENSGEHGAWNTRIFEHAGRAVGEVIETLLDQDLTGVDYDTAVGWFADLDRGHRDVAQRASCFLAALDGEASGRRVAIDGGGRLRRCGDLSYLAPEIEPIIGPYVGDSLQPGHSQEVLTVLRRWGLRRWGPAEVAHWLGRNLPTRPTHRDDCPPFIQSLDHAIELIEYCDVVKDRLRDVALLREDRTDVYYPASGSIRRATQDFRHLIDGLAAAVVHPRFAATALGREARTTDVAWLHRSLLGSTDRLLGKRVPVKSVAVASEQAHVEEALTLLRRARLPLDGVPLALDEGNVLRAFGDRTVCRLPEGPGRKTVAALCRRLGLEPVHPKIDDAHLQPDVQAFSLSLVLELIGPVDSWDTIADTRLLVETIAELRRDRDLSSSVVEQVRQLKIWPSADGETRMLHELRLPPRTRLGSLPAPVLDERLVGDLDPAAPIFATLHQTLRIDVLDMTEQFVMACEHAPSTQSELRSLLEELDELEQFTAGQLDRLRAAPFVLCRDGKARIPRAVFLTIEDLPLTLGGYRVDEAGLGRRAVKHLSALGAPQMPSGEDLRIVATDIAAIGVDVTPDPGRVLWDYLERNYSAYSERDINLLAGVPWITSLPGPERRSPQQCLDPRFAFAASVFPVLAGVRTPALDLRERLRIKGTISAAECVAIGIHAEEHQTQLPREYFAFMERLAVADSPFEAEIAALRSHGIMAIGDGMFVPPERMVARSHLSLWGHLREVAPAAFVKDYPNLARAWGMASEGQVHWQDHLEVLRELATLNSLDARDLALARSRIESLAGFDLDDHQLETVRRQAMIPTSLGLQPYDEAYRGDLPPSTLVHLEPHVPIAVVWDDTDDFLDRLGLPGISTVVDLEAKFRDPSDASEWRKRLEVHAANMLRFLRGTGHAIDRELMARWPPSVVAVAKLSVRARRSGAILCAWESDAHLDVGSASLTLYVGTSMLDKRSVVDAITTAFGVDRGRKSLLLTVLNSATADEGAQQLDWEGFPALSPADAEHVPEPTELQVEFGAAPDPDAAFHHTSDNTDIEHVDDVRESEATAEERGGAPRTTPDDAPTEPLTPPPPAEPEPPDRTSDPYDRVQSPRGVTDIRELEQQGVTTTYDLDDEVDEHDYEPDVHEGGEPSERDEARVCLSYYDVLHGMLPVDDRLLARLTTGIELQSVHLFGEHVPARQFGARHIRIDDGAMIFAAREIVAGTVVRLYPSSPGVIELELRADPHRVNGVWMLELDEHGKLDRLRMDDIELKWETDDAFYRAERRLEDVEALMRDGGKSALQLVTEVFLRHPDEGLSTDEVWGLVAISRLFAKATISNVLSQQDGMFENRDGLWYKVGDELRLRRRQPAPRTTTSSGSPSRQTRNQTDEILRTARRLVRLLSEADRLVVRQVRGILDNSEALADDQHRDGDRGV